ncbi:MAG: hypothetical protein V4555_13055 [Acidobacteriota bacterium]
MKTNIIRACVVALAFAGFSASTVSANTTSVKSVVNVVPTPLCAPGGNDYCGMQ